jgi:uncharacterized membrane protein YphA (DoxX/SURF4 family)
MKILTSIIARILYSVPFIGFGINHLIQGKNMAAYVPIPGGTFWIYFTGIAQLAAAFAIISKIQAKLACLLLALFLLIIIATIQIPGLFNPAMSQFAITNLFKDTGLMGGALLLAGIFSSEEKKVQTA